MLAEVAEEYLSRFSNLMTESVYASKGISDYNSMKKYCDYLDYDKLTLFREKGKTEAGLRNIACYLNVILQLLFHINYLRQKVCSSDTQKSELIKRLRSLFGDMAIGKFIFADPSELFDHLKSSNSDIFVPGVQNDFHQIFTLLIDKISESYSQTSVEDARFIKKILFGKVNTKIDFIEGKTSKTSLFNVINLQVADGSFDKAFQKWRSYTISDYLTPKGSKVLAIAQNYLLETPALLAFFINRVTFKNNKLSKDLKIFQYEQTIVLNKSQHSEKSKSKQKTEIRQKQLIEEKQQQNLWLEKIEKQKIHIEQTLLYLANKQTPLLSQPQIENHLGQLGLQSTSLFLKKELEEIEKKIAEVKKDNAKIDIKMTKLQEQGNYETYLLWAIMVHEGTSANSGHYKVCININGQWNQYNDRLVYSISPAKIQQYKNKGYICCLFYRRASLLCDNGRIAVQLSLKNMVNQHQKDIRLQIDKARLLQCLYQQTESANFLLEHEMTYGINQKLQYFFKPIHYAINEKYPYLTCKGIVVMEIIMNQSFKNGLTSRFISQQANTDFKRLKFGIPQEYFAASEILKSFLNKEAFIMQVPSAYQELASKRVKFTRTNIKTKYLEILQVIVLKGLYYMHILTQKKILSQQNFMKMSQSIDKIIESMGQNSQLILVCISIKHSLRPCKNQALKIRSTIKNIAIDNYGEYFSQNFKFWITQRLSISKIDEANFHKGAPILTAFKQ